MTGTIIEFNKEEKRGTILSDDQKKYQLLSKHWKDNELPQRHRRVEFVLSKIENNAEDIFYIKENQDSEEKGWFSKLSLFWKIILFFFLLWIIAEVIAYFNTMYIQEQKSKKNPTEQTTGLNVIGENIEHEKVNILNNRNMNINKMLEGIDKISTRENSEISEKLNLIHEQYRRYIRAHAIAIDKFVTNGINQTKYKNILNHIYETLETDPLIKTSKEDLIKLSDFHDNTDTQKTRIMDKYKSFFIDVSNRIVTIYQREGGK